LLAEHRPGRYAFPYLLRAYAVELSVEVDSVEQRKAATGRILDHYLLTAYSADRLLAPSRVAVVPTAAQAEVILEPLAGEETALAWFTAEHSVLLAAVQRAASTGFDTHAWQLACTLDGFLNRSGRWHDWGAIGRAALTAAHRLDDAAAAAAAHRLIGRAEIEQGQLAEAQDRLRTALALYKTAHDLAGQADLHAELAYLNELRGNAWDALDHAEQTLVLYRSVGHRRGEASAMNRIGWYRTLIDDAQGALGYCQAAISLFERLGDEFGEALSWDGLGHAHSRLGQHADAAGAYQRSRALSRDVDAHYPRATTLIRRADAQDANGDRGAARESWGQALLALADPDHREPARS
jgi:tetratricopeptide (TPR) repeat protein